MDKQNSKFYYVAIVIFAVVALGAVLVSPVRERGTEHFLNKMKLDAGEKPPPEKIARQWLDAVKKGDKKRGILLASRIVGDDSISMPQYDYLWLFASNGFNSSILTDLFNGIDFIRWQDAVEAKEIADSILKENSKNPAEEIFRAITAKIKPKAAEKNSYPPASAMEIWRRGFGNSKDMFRFYSLLLSQAGIETDMAVIASSPSSSVLICETRGASGVSLADFRTCKLIPGKSAEDIAMNPHLLYGKDAPAWFREKWNLKFIYLAPSEAQDYRLCNQKLASALKKSLGRDAPVFGEDPKSFLERLSKIKAASGIPVSFEYWQVPIIAVYSLPELNKDWTANPK